MVGEKLCTASLSPSFSNFFFFFFFLFPGEPGGVASFWVAISTSTEEGSRRRRIADHTKSRLLASLLWRRGAVLCTRLHQTPPLSDPMAYRRKQGTAVAADDRRSSYPQARTPARLPLFLSPLPTEPHSRTIS